MVEVEKTPGLPAPAVMPFPCITLYKHCFSTEFHSALQKIMNESPPESHEELMNETISQPYNLSIIVPSL